MCSECYQMPCHPRCPNAPEPTAVYTCKHCAEGITVGEEYTEIDGEYYHVECVSDMTTSELLILFGAVVCTAERD